MPKTYRIVNRYQLPFLGPQFRSPLDDLVWSEHSFGETHPRTLSIRHDLIGISEHEECRDEMKRLLDERDFYKQIGWYTHQKNIEEEVYILMQEYGAEYEWGKFMPDFIEKISWFEMIKPGPLTKI